MIALAFQAGAQFRHSFIERLPRRITKSLEGNRGE
jgi:hypothetical protein